MSFRCLMQYVCVLACILTLHYILSNIYDLITLTMHLLLQSVYLYINLCKFMYKFAAQCNVSLDKVSDWLFPKYAQEHTLVFILWSPRHRA